ncbi:MaoC family dehydratase N-terminal domain-containing protein [Rhodococcus oxybenzonivorans]|uniref:FAS1-like dehydratase domain-containing protein n=1 Tax=Rhodococcus oxybenzonivorans TaxID=1990687 RepID=UPI0029550C08|nr:MaoC family dehydratase N-terminal domain-containing protein [Rhodococcus oxybenzonivorans]MDV7352777.1 MaoC family dehydratase N-terminal domain-containing protein [Rhodococcus oxybenzonivorans]
MTTPTVEPSPVGAMGKEWDVFVERGKIREFAAAMQSDNPAYQGAEAVIPPTFLVNAVQWAPAGSRIAVGFDRRRLLHGEQEYTFHGALPKVGDRLTARERLVDRFDKPGKKGGQMRFAIVVTEFRSTTGELIAEARATYIETAAKEDTK